MRLIVVTVVMSVVIGLAAGGSLRDFPGRPLRWWWVGLAGIVVQFVVLGSAWAYVPLVGSFALLVTFALANLRRPGFALIALGLCLNAAVIVANRGMPVSASALRSSDQAALIPYLEGNRDGAKHVLAGQDTRLLQLADVVPLGPPLRQAVSAGDLLVHAGVAWFVIASMHRRRDLHAEGTPVVGSGSAPS